MATTLAAALLDPAHRPRPEDGAANAESPPLPVPAGGAGTHIIVAHVGDSRVYQWTGAGLQRLTEDHSWVAEQVRLGQLSAAEARCHPWRNLVTRAVTGVEDVVADVDRWDLAAGSRLLLCSDGLFGVLSDEEIGQILAQSSDDEAACEMLVNAANLAGGPDNITVVLVTVG
jgi:protein phosphatase